MADLNIICCGTTGHGSLLHDNTAGEKMRYVINKFMNWRDEEKEKMQSNPELTLGDVTTINLTMLNVSHILLLLLLLLLLFCWTKHFIMQELCKLISVPLILICSKSVFVDSTFFTNYVIVSKIIRP